jgi:hypothetical protein
MNHRNSPLSSPTRLALLAICWLAALALFPNEARADEPEREITYDPQAYPAPSTRVPLFLLGAGTTAVWYGAAVGGSYLYPTARGADELRIPIAGPWMSLGQTGCPKTTPNCSTFWMVVAAVFKTLDGIGQAGGVLIMAEGLLLPTVEPKNSAASSQAGFLPRSRRATTATEGISLRPLPLVTENTLGLGVRGAF